MGDPIPIVGRGYYFEDLRSGFRFRTHRRTIAEADLAAFVNLSWLTEELFAVVANPVDDSERVLKGFANKVVNQDGKSVLEYNPLRMLKRKP